jgi:guanylate kinase
MQIDTDIKVLIISGPTGSGKNSILEGVLERCHNCARLVTATTRLPRGGEVDGVDYHFISKDVFLQAIKDGEIPEYWHAQDTDRYYGTYLPDLRNKAKAGNIIVAQVQAEGIKYFKKHYKTVSVLIVAGSEDELIGRVTARHPMTKEELKERLDTIHKEMQEFEQVCDYTVRNENGKLDIAIEEVITILKKENYVR